MIYFQKGVLNIKRIINTDGHTFTFLDFEQVQFQPATSYSITVMRDAG